MKTPLIVLLVVVVTFVGWRVYDDWDHSPARIAAQIEAVRQSHPDLDRHVENYSSVVNRIALPFRMLSTLGSLLGPIDELREYEMESNGQRYRPWQEIAKRSAEAKVLDVAMDAVMATVGATVEVDTYCDELRLAATAFRSASAPAPAIDSEPNAEEIRELHASSVELATRIGAMHSFIVPVRSALDNGDRELENLGNWLEDTSSTGFHEGFVLTGMRTAVGALRSAFSLSAETVIGLAEQMDDDALALREIAELASRVR